MQVPRVKFRPDIQAGQAINLVALITLIWTVSNGLGNLIATVVADRAEMKQQIALLIADRAKYVPMIEAVEKSDALQREQIKYIVDTVQDTQKTNAAFNISVTTAIGEMKSDLAILKARSENGTKVR